MGGSGNRRTLAERLRSGIERRVRALWKCRIHQGPEFPAEAALDWLLEALHESAPDLRAMCTETLLGYGCADHVVSWKRTVSSVETTAITDSILSAARKGVNSSRENDRLSSTDLARAAVHWYSQREMEPADKAFRLLEKRQTARGDFPSPVTFFPQESLANRVLAVKYYLDAAQMRVAAAFDLHGHELPHTIDVHDGRMMAVKEWMASLSDTAKVADVGCGSGRFLAHLAERFPRTDLTGIDPCPALLDQLPPAVRRHEGTLLRTNLADATFDGAFAVESLEHCLVARRGIAELCRLVRPGGRVLLIDKHRSKQPLSEYEPWERWFFPHELSEWLEPYCDEIRVEPVSHSEGLCGEGLFLAASARRRCEISTA